MATNRISHVNCDHPKTPKARAACRRARGGQAPVKRAPRAPRAKKVTRRPDVNHLPFANAASSIVSRLEHEGYADVRLSSNSYEELKSGAIARVTSLDIEDGYMFAQCKGHDFSVYLRELDYLEII